MVLEVSGVGLAPAPDSEVVFCGLLLEGGLDLGSGLFRKGVVSPIIKLVDNTGHCGIWNKPKPPKHWVGRGPEALHSIPVL